MNKCCPRVRVVCKRPKAVKVSTSYYEMKNQLSRPHQKTASVSVQREAICSVKLGGQVIASGIAQSNSDRISKSVQTALQQLNSRGCTGTTPDFKVPKDPAEPTYPSKVPGEVVDVLKAKAKRVKK